jgi:hypothetical protein
MAKENIRIGAQANDKTGDSLRSAFQKVNNNFTELYTALGLNDTTLNLGAFEFNGSVMTTTDSSNMTIGESGTVINIAGDFVPSVANGSDLGSLTKPFRSLFVSNNTVFLGGVPLSLESGTNELQINNVPISQTINYTDIPGIPVDINDLTDTENLLGGGGATSTVECLGNTSTVVYTSLSNQQHTIKLLIQVEGNVGAAANWDTQACEMIVIKKFNGPTVASTVYAVVHTSVAPLATFTAEWNALTSRVEVLCATPSTNSVYVKTFATEITTAD